MNAEWLTAVSSIATFLVIAVTAYAAVRQLRHMRSGNQVAALLPLTEKYQTEIVQDSLNYVMRALAADLQDPEVRAGAIGIPASGPTRAALQALNFYESVGALVSAKALDLELVLLYFTLPSEIWELSQDYIALTRRKRGNEVFENLEALVAFERIYSDKHGTSRYPKHLPRIDLVDRWAVACPGHSE